jgi:hypothetical protein
VAITSSSEKATVLGLYADRVAVGPRHGIAAAPHRQRIAIDTALDLTADGRLCPRRSPVFAVFVSGQQVIERELELIGSGSATYHDLKTALDLLVHGVVKPEIAAVLHLSDAADAPNA